MNSPSLHTSPDNKVMFYNSPVINSFKTYIMLFIGQINQYTTDQQPEPTYPDHKVVFYSWPIINCKHSFNTLHTGNVI